ncbi:MAG: hypothetical protein DCC73_13560 [Proteobacteria bacterium]|nr:MAG: hypothetical protein DCC73_13560 [Pseudomonadota bacterium]
MESIPLIRAAAAYDLVRFLQGCAMDPAPIFASTGLDIEKTNDPYATFDLERFTELLERAAEATGDQAVGLKLASLHDLSSWGAYGYLVLNAPTVGACLRCMAEFLEPWQMGTYVKCIRDADVIGIEYSIRHPTIRRREQDAEYSVSIPRRLVSKLTRNSADPIEVTFEHQQISDDATYRRYLGLKPIFGARVNSIWFDRDLENVPNPNADVKLFKIISEHLKDLSQKLPKDTDLLAVIETQVRDLMAVRTPTIGDVSSLLRLDPRTLQRRLKDRGTCFSDILDRVRHQEALRYLEQTRMEVKEISYLLGFNDASAFIKSFRRWTGETPSTFRSKIS